MRVDLNADMGEGFGDWRMGDDAALLDVVTSANVACGAHAGDWDVMAATMARARDRGVGIGAHPGFADLQGFGRRRVAMAADSLRNLVAWQVGAAHGVAASLGATVRHVKLHGALANICCEDEARARACYEGALGACPRRDSPGHRRHRAGARGARAGRALGGGDLRRSRLPRRRDAGAARRARRDDPRPGGGGGPDGALRARWGGDGG